MFTLAECISIRQSAKGVPRYSVTRESRLMAGSAGRKWESVYIYILQQQQYVLWATAAAGTDNLLGDESGQA